MSTPWQACCAILPSAALMMCASWSTSRNMPSGAPSRPSLPVRPQRPVAAVRLGHGVLDEQGRFYLATRDTQRNLLNATAIPASYITDDMDTCRSKRQVLILDCCHSGAFARGAKGELAAITQATFEGNGFGRVVLTASDSTQYALEGDQVDQSVSLSLFTNYLLEGLTTGEADRGGDGWVDVDEWYDYAYEKILMQTSSQTPKKWAYNTQGELVIARNPRPKPVELPRYLRTAISSELPRVRLEAVDQLENLLSNGAPGMASVAIQELQGMAQDDDSLIVRKRASEVLAAYPQPFHLKARLAPA
jgi:hypothetical protein